MTAAVLLLSALSAGQGIRLVLLDGDAVLVPVLVNGRGPFSFLLDTGTSTTVVGAELADALGLRATEAVRLLTPGGSRVVPRVAIAQLRVGEAAAAGTCALVTSLSDLRARLGPLDGVLGQSFLTLFSYTLDYRRRELRFESAPPRDGTRVPLKLDRGRPIVEARPSSKPAAGGIDMVLDSGAANLLLFETEGAPPPLDVERFYGAPGRLTTSVGSRFVRSGWVKTLVIGEETLRDVPVALVFLEEGQPRLEHGLLPTRLFDFVHFNPREGYVVLRR